ncbi:ABC transporter permease [Endozoicomonas sp. SCSIO W0465]|uniref:ABC transporter permease n=1 Tax=Endozoicomonas sp. SCSIO W0465 TaxID=2918516 RepID=UPI002075AFF0|nr:FtsX-like permease family protein [Endozoicomonas sp. SCSIO W0465]USE37853.1 ABC transporter permease [Endozoicomonas sp. SCSIO W0465]
MVNINWLSHTLLTVQHAMKSMSYRKKNTLTMLLVLAFGFCLVFLFQGIKQQLIDTIDRYSLQSDLIISKETPAMPLVLFSLFHVGSPPAKMSLSLLGELISHPEIEYAIPYAYGETHRGITVIGTSTEGIERLNRQVASSSGNPERKHQKQISPETLPSTNHFMTAYIGVNIANDLGYKINDQITIADGSEPGSEQEYKELFTIAGILPRQNSHQDDRIYIPIDGLITARKQHAEGNTTSWSSPDDIAFIDIKLRDRMALLALEKKLTQSASKQGLAITAAIPARELELLYGYLNRASVSLIFISLVILGLCLLTLFYALTSNLQERRQEIRLYQTLGMSQKYIGIMALLEPLLIISSALCLGFVFSNMLSTYTADFFLIKWLIN